jgi:outer membrane protein insertion porin family
MQQNLAAIARCAQAAGAGLLRYALVGVLLLAGLHARSASAGPFDRPSSGNSMSAGQVPMGRTDPTATTGYPRGSWPESEPPVVRPRYQSPGNYVDHAVQPVQYSAPGGAYAPPANSPYAPPGGFAPNYGAPNAGAGGSFAPGGYGAGNNPVFPPPPTVPPIDQVPPGTLPPPGGPIGEGGLLPPDSPLLNGEQPLPTVPLTVEVKERQTGQFMFGVGVNSNAGLIGNIVIDEQNFDWRRVPRSWEDIRNATAFRGAGQQLRIEAMPGTQLSRYGVTFREPYLFDTRVNFGVSGYYFNRFYQNWTEQRLGGRISFGYQLTPDLSAIAALRLENVHIGNPTIPTPPELARVLGSTQLYSGSVQLVHDTRDSPFLATQGHRFSVELEQAFGTFSFPRAILSTQKYFLISQRADGSGRQVLSFVNDTGFTGSQTPIYENFFAGGYNTLRGFYFRGASPMDMGVQVGGKFEFLNSVEYMLPLTADDALRAVTFVDFGTVEQSTEIKSQDFRVAPGFGLRITIPAMGPAPIALDFAFPVKKAPTDHVQIFQFFMGFNR